MRIAAIAIAFVAFASATADAQTAKCQRSCTDLKNTCVKMGGQGCADNFGACKSTGTYSMPSGRVWTNVCKK
jgi:hypothetical protein